MKQKGVEFKWTQPCKFEVKIASFFPFHATMRHECVKITKKIWGIAMK